MDRKIIILALVVIFTTSLATANDYIIKDSNGNNLFVVNNTGEVSIENGKLDLNGNSIESATIPWSSLNNYPAGCDPDEAINQVGDTIDCVALDAGGVVNTTGGAQNEISFFLNNDTVTSDSQLYWDSANNELGVGIGNPSTALDVQGGAEFRGTLNLNTNKITGLQNPDNAQDAATKSYVDNNDDTGTDSQTLSTTSDTSGTNDDITISNGNTITIDDDYAADDQSLGTSGNQITLDNGGSVTAPYSTNSNQLNGLTRNQFAQQRRTFNINSGSGTEYYKIGKISDGGQFEQGRFSATLYFASDNGGHQTRRVEVFGAVRTSSYDLNAIEYGEGQGDGNLVDLVITETSGTGSNGENEYYLYARAQDYSQSKIVIEHSNIWGNFDYQSGLSNTDLVGTVVSDTQNPNARASLGTLEANRIEQNGNNFFGGCSSGQYIESINADGSVNCATDTDTQGPTDSDTDSEDQRLNYNSDNTDSSGAVTDSITITDGNGANVNTINFDDDFEANTDTQDLSVDSSSQDDVISLTNGGSITIDDDTTTNTDQKVAVDSSATPGYLGSSNDGVLRPNSELSYVDNGNYITLGVQASNINHDSLSNINYNDHHGVGPGIRWDSNNDIALDANDLDNQGNINDFSAANDLDGSGNINSDAVGINEVSDKIADASNSASLGSSSGWYRIASNGPVAEGGDSGDRASATFIVSDEESGQHSTTVFHANYNFGDKPTLNLVSRSSYSNDGLIEKVRLVSAGTYEGAAIEVYIDGEGDSGPVEYQIYNDVQNSGWNPVDWNTGSVPSGFQTTQLDLTTSPTLAVAANGGTNNFEVGRSGAISTKGNLQMNSNRITGVSDPSNAQDAATKSYVDNNDDTGTDDQNLGTSGNQITLENGGSVTAPYANNADTLDGNQPSGLTWSNLGLSQSDVSKSDVGLGNVENEAQVAESGDTMNGVLTIDHGSNANGLRLLNTVNDPDSPAPLLIATDDDGEDLAIEVRSNPDGTSVNTSQNVQDTADTSFKVWSDGRIDAANPSNTGRTLDVGGGANFNANVDMNNNKITGLTDPTNAQDAATKSYVESYADSNDATGTDSQDLSVGSDPSGGGSTTIDITNGASATFTDDFEADTDAQSQCGNDQVLTGLGCVSKYDSADDGDSSSSNEIQDLGQVVNQNNNADGNINMGDNNLAFSDTYITEQSGNHLLLQGRDPDQQLRLTDGGSLVYEEYYDGENVFEVDSQSSSAASVRIGEQGGTVTLDMNNNKITNLAAPTTNNDAVRQQDLSNYVNKNGDTMNGDLNLNGNQLQNVGGTDCASNEALLGDGTCGSTASTLSDVMSNGNSASTDLDMNGKNITDSSKGNVTIAQDLKIHGKLWLPGDGSNLGAKNLKTVLEEGNSVGGHNINFNQNSNIQSSGTNAITLDGNQNVGIPNGNLNLGGNNLTSTSEICAGNACNT